MSKSTPSLPAAPDPVATANAQTASNVQTAEANAALNRVDQTTPYGSVTYSTNGTDPTTGVPIYSQNTSLSPQGQQIFDSEGNLVNSALSAAGNLAQGITTTPLNTNTADSALLNETPQAINSNAANAAYGQATSFLDPQWNQNQQQLQDQLSRQGISVGNQAYNNAQTQFDNSRTQAYQSAADAAINQGITAGSAQNNEALANQQQNINQQIQAQDQPVNLLSALISGSQATGQTQAPSSGVASANVAGTDTSGIAQNSYNSQLASYNAALQQQNSLWGGLSSLGGSLGAAAILSDRRAKRDIKRIGEMPSGLPLYRFKYLDYDTEYEGVMADEALLLFPEAVSLGSDGLYRVNYSRLS